MKRWWLRSLLILVVFASLNSSLCRGAAETKTAAESWISLFNGFDFTGWKIVALTNPAPAVVEDGEMVLRQRHNTSEHTFVASRQKFSDFILELDLKDDPGFNSGILLRCADAPAAAKVRLNGYQVKIDNTPRAWTGGIFDDFGGDWKWLFDLKADSRARAAFKLGEWAHFRIECIGSALKVWVNGVPTCHLIDEKYRAGYLAFKIHSLGNNPNAEQNAIRLKNIRIITDDPKRFAQPMDLLPRRAPPQPDEDDGAIQLPDGFRAAVVADNLIAGRPGETLRFLAVRPNGDLYAITRKGGIFALRDADGDGCAETIKEFGLGGGTGLAVFKDWLYYSSASAVWRYKLAAAELASALKPDAVPELKKFLGDADSGVSYWGAAGLLMRGEPAVNAARPELLKALTDTSASVRVAAAEALGRYGDAADLERVLTTLKEAVDPSRTSACVSIAAMNAIAALGPKAAPLIAYLRTMPTKDPNAVVRANGYVSPLQADFLERLNAGQPEVLAKPGKGKKKQKAGE